MSKFIKKVSHKAGLSPGALVHVGRKRVDDVKIEIIDYSLSSLNEKIAKKVEECFPFKNTGSVTWINVVGVHNADIVEKIGLNFDVHPLVLEDILNTNQIPKIEDFGDYLFIVVKMLYFDEKKNELLSEQVSFILGSNFLISFQEVVGDVFNAVRQRIRNDKGRIRKFGSDYLMYALIDSIVDNYFLVLERIGERIEIVEELLLSSPKHETMNTIHSLKRELIYLRKSVWPLREVISSLQRFDSKLVKKSTHIFLRDLYDHSIQVIDTAESFRDIVSGMVDLYLSSVSNRMNEVMKVLTIIATIFIPLTFIAGIYGMNFVYMPELSWWFGYPLVLSFMGLIGVLMFFYFRKKKWI